MNVKGILLDLDGVLYTGDNPLPGAPGAVRYLKGRGYITRFLSNTTRYSRATIESRLLAFGFDIGEDEIITPAVAAINYILETGLKRCHLLTTRDIHSEFEAAGLFHQNTEADWVVVGDAGDNFNYDTMNQAFRLVQGGAGLIALEKDRYWMGSDGWMLSAGPFVRGIEYATGKTAALIGKPSPGFFGMALRDMGLIPADAVMIGDDVVSDTGGAMKAGMQGILVKTGKFNLEALVGADPGPTMIIRSIAEIDTIL
ncbi:MAG: TIGR01458 family HAD-type hydrolase [Methanomicrobiales archaeon]|nr:TIGR01458 family HAD-type hydrolase [Methanomicrobiales archaeon]